MATLSGNNFGYNSMKEISEKDWRYGEIKKIEDKNWQKADFKATDAVFNFKKKILTKYAGQKIDSSSEKVLKNHWDHEHCIACWQKISEDPLVGVKNAYVNKSDQWICEQCFKDFFAKHVKQ
jgi:hypothetical protein